METRRPLMDTYVESTGHGSRAENEKRFGVIRGQ